MGSIPIFEKLKVALQYKQSFGLLWQAGPGLVVANLTLLVFLGVLPLLNLYIIKLILDAVTVSLGIHESATNLIRMPVLIGLAAGVALINAACRQLSALVNEAQALKVTDHVYNSLHEKSALLDLEYYENPNYFDTLHRAQKEGPYRPAMIINGWMRLGQNAVSLLALAGLLLSFHWGVALILLVVAVPNLLARLKYSEKIYGWQRARTSVQRKTDYYNWLLTGEPHAKELRLFNLGPLFKSRFTGLRDQLRKEKLDLFRKRAAAELFGEIIGILGLFGSLGLIVYRTLNGLITIGDMVMYFQAFQRAQNHFRGSLGGLADLYENNLFLSNLSELLSLQPKVKEPMHPKRFPRPLLNGCVFNDVSFKYPLGNGNALNHISLTIHPGEVVALVGENGSGKTTLAKLLCRLYDPNNGIITLDGIDLRQFDIKSLRNEISAIFQDYAKYHLTARENIWFGNIEIPIDSGTIEGAARKAGTAELIEKLPKGYDTYLGKWLGNGEELSIGEWQKIALARAFFRDAQIIVLDEPTSSLDAKAEYEVFNKFRELLNGRAAVLISHRFSTVRMADRIYVLEKGCIIESGSHDDLTQLNGKYAFYYEKQARHYR
jgi:ATP-binding cassette subfamily B protein